MLRHTQNLKINGASSLALQGRLNHQWIICAEISKANYLSSKIVSAVDITWIEEVVPLTYRQKFRLDDLSQNPIYHDFKIEGVSTSILKNFFHPQNPRIQALINEKNVFFDPNLDSVTLEVWTTDNDTESIKKEVNEIIEYYLKWYENQTFERKHEGSTVAVIGSGVVVRELLLDKETRNFRLTIPEFYEEEHYRQFLINAPLERLEFTYSEGSEKLEYCTGVGQNASSLFEIQRYCLDAYPNATFEFVEPAVRSRKACLSKVTMTWYVGESQRKGFVKYESPNDAIIAADLLNGIIVNHTIIRCGINQKKRNMIIFDNLPADMNEPELEKLCIQCHDSRISDVHIWRQESGEPDDYSTEDIIFEIEGRLMSKLGGCMQYIEDIKVEPVPISPDDFNYYRRRVDILVRRLEMANKIKKEFDAKEKLFGKTVYVSSFFHKSFTLRKEQFEACASTYLKCIKEINELFRSKVTIKNSYYDEEFQKKVAKETGGDGVVQIKVMTEDGFQMNRTLSILQNCLYPRRWTLRDAEAKIYFSRKGEQFKAEATQSLDIYLQEFRKDKVIKMYGNPKDVETFAKKLTEFLDNPNYIEQVISLRGKCISKLMADGQEALKTLRNSYSECMIQLNLVKKEIRIKGINEDAMAIKSKLMEFIEDLRKSKQESIFQCPICMDEPFKPYSLISCSHRFCMGCIKSYLVDLTQNFKDLPAKCMAENCGKPFCLQDIRSLLEPGFLEKLVKGAITNCLDLPEYKPCKTAGCQQVYRIDDQRVFHCDICSLSYCKLCTEIDHGNIPCDKAKEKLQELTLEEMAAHKIKKCPKCEKLIQKDKGCMHMTCPPPCNCHFCWICLAAFDRAEKCYHHIITTHPNDDHGLINIHQIAGV